MSEILRKWLRQRLGLVLDYNLQSFEEIAFDGTLLAKVLHNYGIINDAALYHVNKTHDSNAALNNLHFLKPSLKSIGVDVTDRMLYDVANKSESKAIILFYQLYVALNTKIKVNCLINKNMEEAGDFKKDVLEIKPYNVCKKNEISTSKDIQETKDLVNWHKKYAQLLQKCEVIRKTYVKTAEEKLRKKNRNIPNQTIGISSDKHQEQTTIVRTPELNLLFTDGPCVPDDRNAKNYVQYLNQKIYKVDKRKKAQAQMHKIILSEIMNTMVKKEDEDFKNIISNSILKQSDYEKQITTKLIDIRHQKNIMLENLQAQHKIFNKKKEQEFIDQLFQQCTNLTKEEKRFLQNLKRQQELHKRLWAEKCALKYKRRLEMSRKIVSDLIDLSIKSIEYEKMFNREVPPKVWKEWSSLFTANLPIFDIVENISQILEIDEENPDENLTLELYRQDGLDESDLNDYLNTLSDWYLEDAIQYYEQNSETIDLGREVLGYVIHRLLKLKYPCPPPHPTPKLPHVNVRAALVGVKNHEIINVLQESLDKHHIAVIDITTVINYCLNKYLSENVDDVDKKLNEESKKGKKDRKEKKEKKGKKEKKEKKFKKDKKGKNRKTLDENIIEKIEKEVQTPKLFPDEELKLSQTALIGKAIYETLNLGLEVNDLLLIDSLIEYLKELNNVKGWVLINFPANIEQAYVFEEIFTGKYIPDKFKEHKQEENEETIAEIKEDKEELEHRQIVYNPDEDIYKDIRISKLLPNPLPPCTDEYVSYLTSFVHMFIKNKDYNQNINVTDNSTDPYQNQLTNFYSSIDINNIHIYENVDHDLLRELIYLITKDEYFAKELYEEILIKFKTIIDEKKKAKAGKSEKVDKKGKKGKGDKADKKSDKSKKSKESKKDKKGKKDKGGEKGDASPEEKKPPTPPEEIEEYQEPPKPGEPNWKYIELPLVNEIYKFLPTSWQQLEEVYLNDFKEIFFTKRVYQNQIIPYINEIETHMQEFIDRPDMKQEHLHEFQKIYNDIDKDLREDDEFKAELHNKLSEFRDKLWGIADERMRDSETERQRLINDNWFVNLGFAKVNIFGKAFQLELDRCLVSLQILQDYYSAMAMKIPAQQTLSKFSLNFESFASSSSYDTAAGALSKLFIDVSLNTTQNPFVDFITKSYEIALNSFNSWKNTTQSVLKTVQSKFSKKGGKEKKVGKQNKKEQSVVDPGEFEINDQINQMIEEWTMAIEGEILRTRFRLKLILDKAIDDINNNLLFGEQTFHDIYDRIDERYHEEIEVIDNVCQLFARAIEACEPMQSRLVLDGTDFYIDQDKLFYMDEPFKYEEVKERTCDVVFTIANLTRLVHIFMDLAPEVNMPDRIFIFLLEDMVVHNIEDDYHSPLPLYWQLLNHNDVPKLVEELYGDCEFINWKDFIVWNLLLPYPTEFEILEAREMFTSMDPDNITYVNKQQFFSVNLWFEDEYDCYDLRTRLIKNLLFTMFTIVGEKVDYMGMLFYFCKDFELIKGLSKAIELFCGDFICWDPEVGRKYVKHLWHLKKIEEKRKKEVLSAVNSVLDFIFGEVSKEIDTVSEILGVPTEEEHVEEEVVEEEETTFSYSSVSDDQVEGEEGRAGLPDIIYFLEFDVLINVMTFAFPWKMNIQSMDDRSFREVLEELYEKHKNKHFDNRVFMHEFLNDPEFLEILNKNSKFLVRCPADVVRKLIEVCTCNAK